LSKSYTAPRVVNSPNRRSITLDGAGDREETPSGSSTTIALVVASTPSVLRPNLRWELSEKGVWRHQ
jgi:hypothetical protein